VAVVSLAGMYVWGSSRDGEGGVCTCPNSSVSMFEDERSWFCALLPPPPPLLLLLLLLLLLPPISVSARLCPASSLCRT